jgi:hypothetical protein
VALQGRVCDGLRGTQDAQTAKEWFGTFTFENFGRPVPQRPRSKEAAGSENEGTGFFLGE